MPATAVGAVIFLVAELPRGDDGAATSTPTSPHRLSAIFVVPSYVYLHNFVCKYLIKWIFVLLLAFPLPSACAAYYNT